MDPHVHHQPSERFDESINNIPHMHLFLDLKQKFPELRDGHITDSIQRFGLDRDRCEEVLCRKMQEQRRGYYSPWGQSRSNSVSSTGCRNSPLSPPANLVFSEAPPPVTVLTTETLTSPSSTQLPEVVYACHETLFSPPKMSSSVCQPMDNRSDCSGAKLEEKSHITPSTTSSSPFYQANQTTVLNPFRENNRSDHFAPKNVLTASSAPIKPVSGDIFTYPANRRSSAESVRDHKKWDSNTSSSELIQTQLGRKKKLEEQLTKRFEDKAKLQGEVDNLGEELKMKEHNQRLNVERYKTKIEDIQQSNIFIQSECDKMIREILDMGESPLTEEDLVTSSPLSNTPLSTYPDSLPLHGAGSLSSSLGSSMTSPTTPSRRAPSPPTPVNHSPLAGPTTKNISREGNNATTHRGATEENDENWACSKCTFLNSNFLNECEMCGYLHFSVGTTAPPPPSYFTRTGSLPPPPLQPLSPEGGGGPCYCHRHHVNDRDSHGTGGLQDIHIQVRHRNLHSPMRDI